MLRGIEIVLGGVGFSGDCGQRERGEGMAYKLSIDTPGAVEGGFEWEDDEHLRNALFDPAEAAALPGPELRADKPEDWNAEALAVHGEAEVNIREVNEDGERGSVMLDRGDERAVLRVDVGRVADDFRETHVRDVFSADYAFEACVGHAGSA